MGGGGICSKVKTRTLRILRKIYHNGQLITRLLINLASLAMILSKDQQKFPIHSRNVGELKIEHYNHLVYEESEDQLYASDEAYLQALVSIDKHLGSP